MDMRRWVLIVGVAGLLLASTGCMADQIVYVDEQGNELAVDDAGQPILPGGAPGAGPFSETEEPPVLAVDDVTNGPAPVAAPAPVRAPRPVAVSKPLAKRTVANRPTSDLPSIDPSWDLPPAGGSDRQPSSAKSYTRTAPAAKKVSSSAGLDLPPAGS